MSQQIFVGEEGALVVGRAAHHGRVYTKINRKCERIGDNQGMPDGVFTYQKCLFGYILGGLGIENVRIYNGHLEYVTFIWYISWRFGIFVVICYIYLSCFGMVCQEKSGNPGARYVEMQVVERPNVVKILKSSDLSGPN
jgi:hypothetical protein